MQAPLTDLYSATELCGRSPLVSVELAHKLAEASTLWRSAGGERALGPADLSCFLPVQHCFWYGGQVTSGCAAVGHARQLVVRAPTCWTLAARAPGQALTDSAPQRKRSVSCLS